MKHQKNKLYFKITEETALLFEAYGALLSKKQRLYFELYWAHDWSLAEISEIYHISRSAVYDTIKRTATKVALFEQKLHIVEQQQKRYQVYETFAECQAVQQLLQIETE